LKIISWNIAHRKEPWFHLLDSYADVALLQEASKPPNEILEKINVDDEPWETVSPGKNSPWRTALAKLSDQVEIEWLKPFPLAQAQWG
jgi:hypothetical protein